MASFRGIPTIEITNQPTINEKLCTSRLAWLNNRTWVALRNHTAVCLKIYMHLNRLQPCLSCTGMDTPSILEVLHNYCSSSTIEIINQPFNVYKDIFSQRLHYKMVNCYRGFVIDHNIIVNLQWTDNMYCNTVPMVSGILLPYCSWFSFFFFTMAENLLPCLLEAWSSCN